ncbi:MAG: OB-fold domain-containing protein [Terrimesophilobacter sp.]
MKAMLAQSAQSGIRPVVVQRGSTWLILGARCPNCHQSYGIKVYRCSVCSSVVEEQLFGPRGTIWSHTTIAIPVPDRESPYTIAYVDLDDGPRVLAIVPNIEASRVGVGARVTLSGMTTTSDPLVALKEEP